MTPPVIIVGGGPTGLLLALELHARGIAARVLEREATPRAESRAIGIHPPSLAVLDRLGVLTALVSGGVVVRAGEVRTDAARLLGSLSFASLSRYPYVLVSPQTHTEAVLERHLQERAPLSLRRGVTVEDVRIQKDAVQVVAHAADGSIESHAAEIVVGADGKRSTVRHALKIGFAGGAYPQSFVMGDGADPTGYGATAELFLSSAGLVESFPLPGGARRWVASTPTAVREDCAQALRAHVKDRTGWDLAGIPFTMTSAFGVEHYLADTFAFGRTALVGDAAHVCSPTGGQGMNLGWLDAAALAPVIAQVLAQPEKDHEAALGEYSQRRRRAATRAIANAQQHMRLGIGGRFNPVRDAAIRMLLVSPAKRVLARRFTMAGLD